MNALGSYLPPVNTGPFHFGQARRKGADSKDFQGWLKSAFPKWIWTWKYQEHIQQHLDNLIPGESRQLMLFIPPRHGKSEMVTVRYAAWRLEKDPATRIIVGAYNQTLAEKFSRKIRKVMRDRGVPLSKERTAAEEWETEAGGGVRAAGVGAGVTGMGADLIIIDDPVKNRREANSETYREAVYDWYTDDLYTRREPGASMILIMTRWHEDDLAGRILASEDGPNWQTIKLPALAKDGDPLQRKSGQALCPQRYDEHELGKIKVAIGSKSFEALYQQEPKEQEGDFLKRSWFPLVNELPEKFDALVRYWDYAATAEDGDYTAGVLMGRLGVNYFVIDVVRGQWSPGERDIKIRRTAETDKARWGNVRSYREREPGSSGIDAGRQFVALLAGFPAGVDIITGDKKLRAEPFASQAEYGFVKVLRANWFDAWINELTSFPNGAHDDQVDGTSGAFNKLSGGGPLSENQPQQQSKWRGQGEDTDGKWRRY
jgi:predicted phage terminase large subunit-like protein